MKEGLDAKSGWTPTAEWAPPAEARANLDGRGPSAAARGGRSRSSPPRSGSIHVICRLNAPPERVFHAWLEPEVAGRWLFATAWHPMTDVAIDPRVGGSFRFADRGRTAHTGQYLEIVPHRRLVFTLAMSGRTRVITRVTAEISPLKTGCELALTHEGVPRDRAERTEARWTGILYGLGEIVDSLRGRSN